MFLANIVNNELFRSKQAVRQFKIQGFCHAEFSAFSGSASRIFNMLQLREILKRGGGDSYLTRLTFSDFKHQ
jgi:hypothetical protein